MPRGLGDVSELRLEVLQKFVSKFTDPPDLVLSSLFPSSDSPSSTIKWESYEGGRGMSPFKPPGSPSPVTAPRGSAQNSAEAAFWGEKMYFDEEFLNNIRKEGTQADYLEAVQRLSRELMGLTHRCNRRKEWIIAQMLCDGEFNYDPEKGTKQTVSYSMPISNQVALAADYKWSTGTSRNILGDIIGGKSVISDGCGRNVEYGLCNSTVLKYMAQDSTIQTLLQKFTYGDGGLFKGKVDRIVGVNPVVVSSLLNIKNLIVYDEVYEARAMLTAAVTGASTTVVSVDDVSDFVVGGTLRFVDVSAGTYEEETIASIQGESGTVTVSTAPTASFKAGEDYVSMVRKFVPDDKFIMFAGQVGGQPIAEYKKAPFGLDRHYGLKADQIENKDPDGIFIRVQDKGLPVLYQRDAVYQLTVA